MARDQQRDRKDEVMDGGSTIGTVVEKASDAVSAMGSGAKKVATTVAENPMLAATGAAALGAAVGGTALARQRKQKAKKSSSARRSPAKRPSGAKTAAKSSARKSPARKSPTCSGGSTRLFLRRNPILYCGSSERIP